MTRPPRIWLSAGEASGDGLGAGLALALRRRRPDVELAGMGGPRMRAAGVRIVQDSAEVAVVGITEVLAELPAIRRAMQRLEQGLVAERPELLVPIDFPDFNLRLAARARSAGIGVVYFVSPQVWAWRRWRVGRIRRLVRRMLVLFPFEHAFYERAGVPVTFVGHPLAERAAQGAVEHGSLCRRAGLDPDRPVVALMPGSRRSEVSRLAPILGGAARLLVERRPELQFVVPLAEGLDGQQVAAALEAAGARDVHLHRGDWPEILRLAVAGAVASGTASLESALEGLPLVVVYRMSAPTYLLGRLLVRLDHVALPNLVVGRRIVPELIQGDCTPARVAEELARYLDDERHARAARTELECVRERLGGPGAFERAAEAVLAELPSAAGGPGPTDPPGARVLQSPAYPAVFPRRAPMIRSMTGYGQASADLTDVRVEVVLRSVNHRYSDLRLRIPAVLGASEGRLRRQVLAAVRRGRIEASIEIVPHAGSEPRPQLNRPLVEAIFQASAALRDEFGIAGQPDLPAVLAVPGLFRPAAEDAPWVAERAAEVEAVLAQALAALDEERAREGQHLAEEMRARLAAMQELARRIGSHADGQPAAVRDRLAARLAALGPDLELDPSRLAHEAVLLADRCDVTEERVRLEGHLAQSRELVERPDGEPLGKRLEFLLQEIHRETNTINSKSVSLELSRLGLAMKSEVEKLREQVQNLE